MFTKVIPWGLPPDRALARLAGLSPRQWRCYLVALVWDLSKAYHSIYISKREKVPETDCVEIWQIRGGLEDVGFRQGGFGDVPASDFLEMVKELAGVLGWRLMLLLPIRLLKMVMLTTT
jgi:hypothetical protein